MLHFIYIWGFSCEWNYVICNFPHWLVSCTIMISRAVHFHTNDMDIFMKPNVTEGRTVQAPSAAHTPLRDTQSPCPQRQPRCRLHHEEPHGKGSWILNHWAAELKNTQALPTVFLACRLRELWATVPCLNQSSDAVEACPPHPSRQLSDLSVCLSDLIMTF